MRQVEGSLAQVEAQIPVLEAGLDSAMNALDVLLAVQPGTYRAELSAEASIPVAPGLAETGTPAEMIRRRPDLIVAERRLAAASARIGVAISEYYPKFSLGGLLGSATAIASGNLFTGAASQALGVLGLRWRLFDFGRIDAQIAAARGQEAEALAAYRLAVLRATEDVENAFSALVKREAQVGILTRGESSFARARENSFAAYTGVGHALPSGHGATARNSLGTMRRPGRHGQGYRRCCTPSYRDRPHRARWLHLSHRAWRRRAAGAAAGGSADDPDQPAVPPGFAAALVERWLGILNPVRGQICPSPPSPWDESQSGQP